MGQWPHVSGLNEPNKQTNKQTIFSRHSNSSMGLGSNNPRLIQGIVHTGTVGLLCWNAGLS